ncbi:type VII secretion protein EccB [Corynebacterium sp. UBA2622]|uniref:type VII secretion protein EccB n=1 Tax=Corynebacterium sp. UBA2622 TaxID=1946393 RepID=UPI0025C0CA81|nr:type VII secretion protein EccB [Corynebacterium sp. UBA2622]
MSSSGSGASQRPSRLLPTTRPQVTGHRFMRRRVEHGLLFGDIRMIHDPLAARRRAMLLGAAAVAMIAAVMALFAWLRPNPDPGGAPILRDPSGNLFVRVGDAVHPVTNLTSARLVAGSPEEPARVGEQHLLTMPRGVPVGIPTAPSSFAPPGAPDLGWAVCEAGGTVTVSAAHPPRPLDDASAVLATVHGRDWLVTAGGRTLLPEASSPHGRVVRRVLGVDADTPRWRPPDEVLNALRENPPVALPTPLPEVLETDAGSWAVNPAGGIQPVTPTQRDILADAGAPLRRVTRDSLSRYEDAAPALDLHLPAAVPRWEDPSGRAVCVDEGRGAATADAAGPGGAVELSGGAVATHFTGLAHGAVAVDTGHGHHVVSTHGLRHEVPERPVLEVIGVELVENVPWEILSLLPAGERLNRESALTATY